MILLGRLGYFACESCAFPSLVPPSDTSAMAWEPGHGHGASLISPCCWSANADEEDPKALLAQRHLPLQALEQLLARPFCLCRPLCLPLSAAASASAAASSSRTTRRSNSAACNRPIRALRQTRRRMSCMRFTRLCTERMREQVEELELRPRLGVVAIHALAEFASQNERQKCLDLAPSVGRPLL